MNYRKNLLLAIANAKYETINTNKLQISNTISSFFIKYKSLFDEFKNLWIKGGGARSSLVKYVSDLQNSYESGSYTKQLPDTADIDLILIGGTTEQFSQICHIVKDDVSAKDIELEPSIDSYFSSRDISVNEVLLRPEIMLTTRKAIVDITKGSSKPSPSEYNINYENINPKVSLRNILISIKEGLEPHESVFKSLQYVNHFTVLVYLLKAYEAGIEGTFFNIIKPYVNMRQDTPFEALDYLIKEYPYFNLTEKQKQIYENEKKNNETFYYEDKYSNLG